ncbi:hypothetical protein [Azohydromonas caseinilytica]|uniref:Uncharacterized protein n=1 Tax=Azohydromonas caseinilytica TaxID=2728836 RepID=A0A848FIW9_9BURK|nr:hypothetical protein [Azohydromonas caseinilytica]NML18229.1 hypothetical protein [Azohydromonas caseinilytica]
MEKDQQAKQHNSYVSIAIPAAATVITALITSVAQYYVAVAPLKARLNESVAQNAQQKSPEQQKSPLQEIKGSDIFFQMELMPGSTSPGKRNDKENEEWDLRCAAYSSKTLHESGLSLVSIQRKTSARGEKDGTHIGVVCESEANMAIVFAMAPQPKTISDNDRYEKIYNTFRENFQKNWGHVR